MILIEEKIPNKASGLSSLFISFKYNPEIIEIIKGSTNYYYNKSNYTWEVPINNLAYLIDSLTYVDDITLKLLKDDEANEKLNPKLEYKIKPFDHQLEAVTFGLNRENKGFLLLDQPGLGKTGSVIYLAEELKEQKGLEHCLIVCGINTLKANWEKEIKKFSDLPVRVIGKKINKKGNVSYASIIERAEEIMKPIEEFFIVINVEMLRNDDIIQALKTTKNKIDMIVLDEAHKCSGVSQQSKNLLKLKNYKYKIGLTGTLLTNTPLSAFIPLKWIGVEQSNFTNFKSQYCVFGGFGGHQILGYKNIEMLKDIIDSCSLRRTKDMLNIPLKTLIKEVIELDDENKKFYDNVKEGIKEQCDKVVLNSNNVLALSTRLRQATSCPSALTTEKIKCSKLQRACELVEDIISQGEKVVIMCTFKESVHELKDMLAKYNPLLGTGDIKDDEVSRNIDKFQNEDKYKIFIATTAKCGTGITLNAATYMICIDLPWTWALFEQVQDRIHRVTNTKPVFIYELISQNTIDEAVDHIVQTKKALSDFMVDDNSDESTIEVLRDYIQDL